LRAVYIERDFQKSETVVLGKEKAHHLLNVVRVKETEVVLLLNGKGTTATASLVKLSKKEITMEILEVKKYSETSNIHLTVGITKKEAFTKIIKSAVELGVKSILPYTSQYSQSYPLNYQRQQKLIESSCEQSNNPYFLELKETSSFEDLTDTFKEYDVIVYFTPKAQDPTTKPKLQIKNDKILIIIGPEGGLAQGEEEKIQQLENVFFINLPTPILRAETAAITSIGYLLGLESCH
jgi:16S rRNA (uracil1498-N3)-methyltransferase